MAADMRVTSAGAMYPATKLFRIGTSIFGTAGDGFMGLAMIEWLKSQRNRQMLYKTWGTEHAKSDIELIEIRPGGIYLWDGWGIPEKVCLKAFAIGSGQMVALQAMKSGSSPHDAVKCAMEWDECTGPPIQVESLKKAKR